MLRFHAVLSLAAGSLFAVPALRAQEPEGVREALAQTVQALESLAGIETRLAAGEDVPHQEILAATEAPLSTAMERDAFLVTLREEVSALALRHDRILAGLEAPSMHGPAGSSGDTQTPASMAGKNPGGMSAGVSPPATTGLPDSLRRSLFDDPLPLADLPERITRHPGDKRSFEPSGYSADRLREGRLYCRARRFAEAITILEDVEHEPEAAYWIAHAYEGLGRHEDALSGYAALAESSDAGIFKERAARDLDFLRWKIDFESRTRLATGKNK